MRKSLILRLACLTITAVVVASCSTPTEFKSGIPPLKDQALKLSSGSGKTVVTLFADFQCPGCQAFHRNIESTLEELAQSGIITFERKNYPLTAIHKGARIDALGALCAASAGSYDEYRGMMYKKEEERAKNGQFKSALTSSQIALISQDIGLDGALMEECIREEWYSSELTKQIAEANRYNIPGTPSVLVDGALIKGINNADSEGFKTIITKYISEKK